MTSRKERVHPSGYLHMGLRKSNHWYWIVAGNVDGKRYNSSLPDVSASTTASRIDDPYPYSSHSIEIDGVTQHINGYGSNLPEVHQGFNEGSSHQHPVSGSRSLPDTPRNYSNYESRYSQQERMMRWASDDAEADAALKRRERQRQRKGKGKAKN